MRKLYPLSATWNHERVLWDMWQTSNHTIETIWYIC